mgnify:CR=1 FL=1
MAKTKEQIIADLTVAIPYFREAIKDAQAESPEGRVQMAITTKNPDGSGQVGMSFDPVELFNDIASLIDLPEPTEEDDINYKAEKLRGMLRANGANTINGEPM